MNKAYSILLSLLLAISPLVAKDKKIKLPFSLKNKTEQKAKKKSYAKPIICGVVLVATIAGGAWIGSVLYDMKNIKSLIKTRNGLNEKRPPGQRIINTDIEKKITTLDKVSKRLLDQFTSYSAPSTEGVPDSSDKVKKNFSYYKTLFHLARVTREQINWMEKDLKQRNISVDVSGSDDDSDSSDETAI